MWSLYVTATATGQRPSSLMQIRDAWAAYQFDAAVVMVGRVIENAAQEQHNVGGPRNPKWVNRYSMDQLLDDAFRLPRPLTEKERERESLRALKAMAGSRRSGVKLFKGK